eukprot:gnl/MRDRNA2_/MRDRNA2_51404_c0_seq1.p1 gnl/MRDRNA2_/MRDRNA2_51404_c0~~gnl/MRDRNA2_/MRDRNA2_51404_c0_seq1.p1  ORF type:complete len:163 (+),score=39.80 gnl/MRDRNA2_/MRDRNA2_51404_c0_seq1:92-580(+)
MISQQRLYKMLEKLKEQGFNIEDDRYTAEKLKKDWEFSAEMLMKLGFGPAELPSADFDAISVFSHGVTPLQLKALGFPLKKCKGVWFPWGNTKELKAAEYSAWQLIQTGYKMERLKVAGCKAEHNSAGHRAGQLVQAGFKSKRLKAAGCMAEELQAAAIRVS